MTVKKHLERIFVKMAVGTDADASADTAVPVGTPLMTELRISGGGSQSDAAMQLTADIFGLPTSRPHIYETSGLGAAIDASVGLGLHPDFKTAVQAMTRIGKTFEPIAANHATYNALYHRVYQKMYGRLQPLYQAIQNITGYPRMP